MRGTVLVLDSTRIVDIAALRETGLVVHQCDTLGDALARLERVAVDVIVAAPAGSEDPAAVRALRGMADYATSIIVVAVEGNDAAPVSGADARLPRSASTGELLDRVHRALILRRSGRRLPWS